MFIGVIKTKDVLLNPLTLISMRGVRGFLKLVYRALSRKRYSFINMIEQTQWVSLNKEGTIHLHNSAKSPKIHLHQ